MSCNALKTDKKTLTTAFQYIFTPPPKKQMTVVEV